MAKTPTITKFLLTNFTVDRADDDGKVAPRTLPANSAQKLTQDEVELLDKLTKSTGREHYREPRVERAIDGEDNGLNAGQGFVSTESGDGVGKGAADAQGNRQGTGSGTATVPSDGELDSMTVKDLKEYLGSDNFAASDDKPTLLTKAKAKAAAARLADGNGGL